MTDLVPVSPAPSADDEQWQRGLALVGAWLMDQDGNTLTTYADAIGYPRYVDEVPDRTDRNGTVSKPGHKPGDWRGSATLRYGVTWLHWCATNGVHLFDAQRVHIQAWLAAVNAAKHPTTGKPLSKTSKAHMLSTVSSFYRWAMQEGYTESNPAELVNRAKKGLSTRHDKSNSRSLSRAEAAQMQRAADNDPVEAVRLRSAAIIALLFTTGMRASELCGVTLDKMYVQDGQRVIEVTLKGGRKHVFPMSPGVKRRVDAYLASRADVNRTPARRGQVSAATTPLFMTNRGLPMNRREVLRLVKRLALTAGLDDPGKVYTHAARHTVITEVRRGGRSNEDAQHLVGHLWADTTERYGEHILRLADSPVFDVAKAFGIDDE